MVLSNLDLHADYTVPARSKVRNGRDYVRLHSKGAVQHGGEGVVAGNDVATHFVFRSRKQSVMGT